MADAADLNDLYAYLTRSSRLSEAEVQRLVQEVMAFMDESAEEFIRRRHQELQTEGFANEAIYGRLGEELRQRRFRAPDFSQRQIRRLVYG